MTTVIISPAFTGMKFQLGRLNGNEPGLEYSVLAFNNWGEKLPDDG
jgi:hypothetical protein